MWTRFLLRLTSNIQPSYRFSPFKYRSYLNSTHQPTQTSHSVVCCLCRRRDPIAFAAALSFASNSKDRSLGSQIHAQIIKLGLCSDMFSQNNLIVMYTKCKLIGDALNMFEGMTERNIVSSTAMISGCVHNDEFDMGLEIYLAMNRSGFHSNEFTLASVFSACAALEAITLGSSLHSQVFKTGMHENLFVCSSLLYMYAKCGYVETAEQVFELVKYRDIACWNAMLEGYALNNCGYDAMRFVSLMLSNGVSADQFTYTSVLKGCSETDGLTHGQQVHGLVIRNELEFSTMVMNSLAGMYIRTGKKDSALKVFSRTQHKDVISWNTVMAAFAQDEDATEVVSLFSKMLLTGLKLSQVTLSIISRLCGAKNDLALGLQFFGFVYHLGFVNDTLVVNSLIDMFAKCGSIENAHLLFVSLPNRNIVTWNEMIVGYNLNGHHLQALQLYYELHKLGIRADEFTYSGVLGSCHGIQHQRTGEQVHACAVKNGLDSSCFVGSSLVNAYAKYGLVEDSFKIFQCIGKSDLVSWGNMISVFSKHGFDREALMLLNCFREAGGKPDEFVLGTALSACANIAAFQQGKCIHSQSIKTGFEKHSCVVSAVIDTYAKCGDIDSSKKAFRHLPKDDDLIVFNTMITAYAHHGHLMEAIKLFEEMKWTNLEPSHATFVAVISACSHFGIVEEGQRFFDSIRSEQGMAPSMENYACLVDLHARNGFLEKAKEIIQSMPFEPWPAIWRSLLSGCRIYGNKDIGKLAAEQIILLMPNNAAAHILLSSVYAAEGSWDEAGKEKMIMLEKGLRKEANFGSVYCQESDSKPSDHCCYCSTWK